MSRILVVGAGAVGGYFGARLIQAGKDVTFLVRPQRAARLAEKGLRIRNVDGSIDTLPPNTVTATELRETSDEGAPSVFDSVVLAVKAYAVEQAIEDLRPAIGPGTVIVPTLNGIQHIQRLIDTFGPDHVYGGVCLVATALEPDGTIAQLNKMQSLRYGPLRSTGGVKDDRLAAVAGALGGAGFSSETSTTIEQDMWDKWLMLASLGAITCLMHGTIGQVNTEPGGTEFATSVVQEITKIMTAAGHQPSESHISTVTATFTDPSSPLTSSMYRDQLAGSPTEHDQILGDLITLADQTGQPAVLTRLSNLSLTIYESARAV